jgi:hypothetical protein
MEERERVPTPQPEQNPETPAEEWVSGDEPMTGPQASYLHTLCQETGEEFDETLSQAAASQRIEELQAKVGRGGDDPPRRADRER